MNINLFGMRDSLAQRGPDDEGLFCKRGDYVDHLSTLASTKEIQQKYSVYSSEVLEADTVLFHRRLAIHDLSSLGHQPMSTQCGRYIIVFNGCIYNFKEIKNELLRLGDSFVGNSDTEVLLAAYRRFGPECLNKLNGDFAFAIYDRREDELFVARDRLGIKPLFYSVNDSGIFFASNMRTIINSGFCKSDISHAGLIGNLTFGICPRPQTIFKNIQQLEPGTWGLYTRTGLKKKEIYWTIPTNQPVQLKSYDEALEELGSLLRDSVSIRANADVPVSTLLSGGIDSTAIAACLTELQENGVKGYTLGYGEDSTWDETKQASETAKYLNLEHITAHITPQEYMNELQIVAEQYEEPFHNISPNYAIAKVLNRNNCKVVLNGLGGDELFGGYWYYSRKLRSLSNTLPNSLYKIFSNYAPNKYQKLLSIMNSNNYTSYHSACLMAHNWFDLKKLMNLNDETNHPFDSIRNLYTEGVQFRDDLDEIGYLDLKNYLCNHHVERSDTFMMNNGIEVRFPLLDHRVVEFAKSLPSEFKVDKKSKKRILRDSLKGRVPENIFKQQKTGFALPLEKWMRTEYRDFVGDMLENLKKREIFNASEVDRWHHEFKRKQRRFSDVWHLVAIEIWLEKFDV